MRVAQDKSCLIVKKDELNIVQVDSCYELVNTIFAGCVCIYNEDIIKNENLNELKKVLIDVLSSLTEREQIIIKKRYGLFDGNFYTLEEVGREFELSGERIRQLEDKALRKLRHPSRYKKIENCLKTVHGIYENYINYGVNYLSRIESELKEELCYLIKRGEKKFKLPYLDRIFENNSIHMSCKANAKSFEINVVCKEERTNYKFFTNDMGKIADELYEELFASADDYIIHGLFSPELVDLLLLKGFIHTEDVLEKSEIIQKQLIEFGSSYLADEIKRIKDIILNKKKGNTVLVMDKHLTQIFKDNPCITFNSFYVVASELGNDESKERLKKVKSLLDDDINPYNFFKRKNPLHDEEEKNQTIDLEDGEIFFDDDDEFLYDMSLIDEIITDGDYEI